MVDAEGRTLLLPPPIADAKFAGSNANVPVLVSRMWHFPTIEVDKDPAGELRAFVESSFPLQGKRAAAIASVGKGETRGDLPANHGAAVSVECYQGSANGTGEGDAARGSVGCAGFKSDPQGGSGRSSGRKNKCSIVSTKTYAAALLD